MSKKGKFNYNGEDFYKEIEELAMKGLTDRHIARSLVVKFGENLNPNYFSALKNEVDEKGEPTERAKRISEALAQGREKINLIVRDTYLKTALGGKKTKDIVRAFAERKCECKGQDDECPMCGGVGKIYSTNKAVVQEIERELPPSIQAMSTWLFNHDEEWRKSIIEGKKLDITSNGGDINKGIVIEVIDKREQVEKDTDNGSL